MTLYLAFPDTIMDGIALADAEMMSSPLLDEFIECGGMDELSADLKTIAEVADAASEADAAEAAQAAAEAVQAEALQVADNVLAPRAAQAEPARFVFLSDDVIEAKIEALRNPNTQRSSEFAERLYNSWRMAREQRLGVPTPVIQTTTIALFAAALRHFLHETRRKDGSPYAPSSMKTVLNSLCRVYSKAHKDQPPINLWKDAAFKDVRAALDAYAAELLEAGYRSSHADALTPEEWKAILALPQCSMRTPEGLLFRLYVLISRALGVRIQEHHRMKREWFTVPVRIVKDALGHQRECLVLPIAADKTHKNGIARVGNEDANAAYLFSAPPGTPPGV